VMKASEISGCQDSALNTIKKTLSGFPDERLVRGTLTNLLG